MKIKKTILALVNQDYFFSVFSKMVGVVIAVIYSAFYTRYLGAMLKGDAAIISNYISLFSAFAAFGMYESYPYYKKKEKDKDIFYSFINNMTSLYLVMMILCVVLTCVAPINSNLKFAVCMVPIQSLVRHYNHVVMIEAPRRRNIASIVISLQDLVVVIAFFFLSEATYFNLILILLLHNFLNLIISWWILKVDVHKLRVDFSCVVKYGKYGFLIMITLFLITINYRVDILMLENVYHVSKADIGVYSVGVSLAEKIWLIPDALKDILMSHLAKGASKEETAKVTRVSLFVVAIMSLLLVVMGKPVVLFLYGAEYEQAYTVLLILMAGVIGMIFYKMIYAYNVVNGKKAINFIFLVIAALINIVGNYIFIPYGGMIAASWVSVISYIVCGVAFLVYFCAVEKIKLSDMLFIKKKDVVSFKAFFK